MAKFFAQAAANGLRQAVGWAERSQDRYVWLPGAFVQKLKEECQCVLDKAAKSGELEQEGAGLRLTDNDVITAWFMKVC